VPANYIGTRLTGVLIHISASAGKIPD
jgi:hypothetical protein